MASKKKDLEHAQKFDLLNAIKEQERVGINIFYQGLKKPVSFMGVPIHYMMFFLFFLFVFLASRAWNAMAVLGVIFIILRQLLGRDIHIFRRFRTAWDFKKYFFFKNIKNPQYLRGFTRKEIMQQALHNNLEVKIKSPTDLPSFRKFVPYHSLIDENVVLTGNYKMLATIEFKGVDFMTLSNDALVAYHKAVQEVVANIREDNMTASFATIRQAIQPEAIQLKADYSHCRLARMVMESYHEILNANRFYQNSFFLTLEFDLFVKADISKKDALINFRKLANDQYFLKVMPEKIREFKEKLEFICLVLKDYAPRLLGVLEQEGKIYSEQLAFYSKLMGGFESNFLIDADLNLLKSRMNGGIKEVYFNKDYGAIYGLDNSVKYFVVVELDEYSPTTKHNIFDKLNDVDCEFIFTHNFTPIAPQQAKSKVEVMGNQFFGLGGATTSAVHLRVLEDKLAEGEVILGLYSNSLVLFGTNLEILKKTSYDVISRLNQERFLATLSCYNIENYFFAKMAGNHRLSPYSFLITSTNYADYIAMHNCSFRGYPKNVWGSAVCIFPSIVKSPVYLNFHLNGDFGKTALGHTLILGQSGAGKTIFMNFTFNALTQYAHHFPSDVAEEKQKFTAVYMDKDYGAYGNIVALGGEYIKINMGEDSGFNPFKSLGTEEDLQNLKTLIKMLVTRNGLVLNVSEEEQLNFAITHICKLDDLTYPITQLIHTINDDFDNPNSLVARLRPFSRHYNGEFGWLFDNTDDMLDFDRLVIGIDGTNFLDAPEVCPYICFYLFSRILKAMDGRRFVLDIDEAWKWVGNEYVGEFIFDMLKTARKRNAIVRLATQSVSDFLEVGISKALVEQCATKIFLSNTLGIKDEYTQLGVSDEEFNIIRNFKPQDYRFLIKQIGVPSLVCVLNLRGMDKALLKILSTDMVHTGAIAQIVGNKKEKENMLDHLLELYR